VLDVSVVVPVRNAEVFIDGCLSAIARAEPREIIVVDGNSTDRTVEIAHRYPVRVLCDQGKGVAAARMLGVTNASSDAVALIDVDILLPDDALERLHAEYREGGYVALQAGLKSTSNDGYWGRALVYHHNNGRSKNWPGVMATIFDRDALLRYGFDEAFASGEDIELRWRLREGGEKLGVSRQTIVEHRFDDTFSCARGQFKADGEGLARMAMKYRLRATHLLAIPAAGAVRGIGLSLARAQPQWLLYFVCYMTLNYTAMAGQFASALWSRIAALNPRTNYEQA
jgi:glycosyltransferase involved in cell wall biosynthesis